MRILITGGSGFIGSSLARKLVTEHSVITVDLLDKPFAHPNLTHYKTDFRNISKDLLEKIDVVYHLAARLPVEKLKFGDYLKVNTYGTDDLVTKSVNADVSRFIFVSSSAVYAGTPGPLSEYSERIPIEPYGKSKLLAEQCCEIAREVEDFNITIVRPRTVIGKHRLGILYLLMYWIRNNKNVYLIGNGNNRFQLLSLDDLVDALELMIYRGFYQDFNLGTNRFGTLKEDISYLISGVGSESRIVCLPSCVKYFGRLVDPFIPVAKWHYMTLDRNFYFDISAARHELKWNPKYSNLDMLLESYKTFNVSHKASVHLSPIDLKILKWLP
ncbi:MAG: NAD-dependent epimerase/dehydratase family protein [Candidatus Thorarchaeota archaeon]